jgi:class 3 adenylate cyclase
VAVGTGHARVSTTRRVVSLWYFVVVVGSLGVLTPLAFAHAAFRLRRGLVWLFALGHAGITTGMIFLLSVAGTESDAEGGYSLAWFFGTILFVTVACVHLARLRLRILYPPPEAWVQNGMHCGLFSVDIAGFGRVGRTSETFVQVRRMLFGLLANAFEVSGISWDFCLKRDTGDGMIVVVPPHFPKVRLLYPLIAHLSSELACYNASAPPAMRIRVRVAIHAGEIRLDEYGVTGRPKVLLARLLDSRVLRDALTEAPPEVPVAVLVSDRFHEDIQDQGEPGLDTLSYRPVSVQEKETDVRAWLHLPDPVIRDVP